MLTVVEAVFVKYIYQDIFKLILGIFLLLFSRTKTFATAELCNFFIQLFPSATTLILVRPTFEQ
jgi:hypothetical protein